MVKLASSDEIKHISLVFTVLKGSVSHEERHDLVTYGTSCANDEEFDELISLNEYYGSHPVIVEVRSHAEAAVQEPYAVD